MTISSASVEIDNFVAAVELLREVFVELQSLACTNSRLHFAMRDKHFVIGTRLDMLGGIVELLKLGQEPLRILELRRRAKALIVELGDELEQFALIVDDDFAWINVAHTS